MSTPANLFRKYSLAWVVIFTSLAIWLIDIYFQFDITWFRWFNQSSRFLPDQFWTIASLGGNGWACFAIAFPLILFAPRLLMAGIYSGIFTAIFSHLFKLIIDSPRPAGILDPSTFHIVGKPLLHYAMPSGHTMTAFGIAVAIFLSISMEVRKKYLWLLIWPLLTGISRMALGAHWPEDVLIGATLGTLCGIGGAWLSEKFHSQGKSLKPFFNWIVIFASLICAYTVIFSTLDYSLNVPFQYSLIIILCVTWLGLIWQVRTNKFNV